LLAITSEFHGIIFFISNPIPLTVFLLKNSFEVTTSNYICKFAVTSHYVNCWKVAINFFRKSVLSFLGIVDQNMYRLVFSWTFRKDGWYKWGNSL